MKPSASGLDGGQGHRSTRPKNMVRPSVEGSWERRDTSWCERCNAPCRYAYPNTGGDEDEHDDQDNYWSGASSQGASGDAPDLDTA